MLRDALLAALAGTGVFLILHFLWWRWRPSTDPRMVLLWSFGALGIVSTMGLFFRRHDLDVTTAASLIWINGLLIVLYTFFYAGICRSVSVTLLSRLLESRDRPVPFDALVETYVESSRFCDRLDLMARSGLVTLADGKVQLTRKGRRSALLIKNLSRWLGVTLEG